MTQSFEESSHFLAGKSIIVAGGGLSGMAFVRGLIQYWPRGVQRPSIAIYERDPRELPPLRGNYSLGLRSDSHGIQAIAKLGLLGDVFEHRTPGTEANGLLIRDANWNKLFRTHLPSPDISLPAPYMRITRHNVRGCFVRGVEDDADIHWEVSCTSAAKSKSGRIEVALSDGSIQECDLLIVADGASSKLRKCLRPDDKLNFAGAVLFGGNATFPSPDHVPEKLRKSYGPVIGGEGHALFVFQISPSSYVWFLTRREKTPRCPVQGVEAAKRKEEIIKEVLDEGKAFTEPFPTLLAHTDAESLRIMNAQDKPPINHPSVSSFLPAIFIGDANHAVSPFAGNGANMAIIDGQSLSASLARSSSLSSAIKAFNKESLPRCKKTLNRSHLVIWMAHTTGWTMWCLIVVFKILDYMFQ